MKTLVALGMAVTLAGGNLFAQPSSSPAAGERSPLGRLESYRDCDMKKVERQLLASLSHDLEGVVVSTLREVAKIKLAQPACTSEPIASQVAELVQTGDTPAIRYKAYLTSFVLSNPLAFSEEGVTEYRSDEEFFTALARKLEQVALRDTR